MFFRVLVSVILFAGLLSTHADDVSATVYNAMGELDVRMSKKPYSRVIKRMYVGLDAEGVAITGIALREIEQFNSITTMVVVDKQGDSYILREVLIPDIQKMRKPDERKQVLNLLQRFTNVPFDPFAEKSAVDVLSGATRYSVKMTGYLNYLARRIALEMKKTPDWPKKQ